MFKIEYLDFVLLFSYYRNVPKIDAHDLHEYKYKLQQSIKYQVYIDLSRESFFESINSSYAFLVRNKDNNIEFIFKSKRSKLNQAFIKDKIEWKYPRQLKKELRESFLKI